MITMTQNTEGNDISFGQHIPVHELNTETYGQLLPNLPIP